MKAFILAAGLGKRLRPLTNAQPKPLIEVGGLPLILWHINKLRDAGITDLVINAHWLADQLMSFLGDGEKFGVTIRWSHESVLLDTGGGISAALPLLGDDPFALISADIWSDFDYSYLPRVELGSNLARLIVVPAPDFAPQGDFVLAGNGQLALSDCEGIKATYSGISVLEPAWVKSWNEGLEAFALTEPLMRAVTEGQVKAELHRGRWTDVGTPERLAQLRQEIE